MKPKDRKLADKKFLQGDTSLLVATEAFELGVDNPGIRSKDIVNLVNNVRLSTSNNLLKHHHELKPLL